MLDNASNIYRRQLACLTFFAVVSFKIVMLPKFLSMGAGHDIFLGMMVALAIEMLLFMMTFYIVINKELSYMYINIWVRRIIYLCIILSLGIRFMGYAVEMLDYVSSLLFQEGRWLFIILTMLPALAYIVSRGANSIARLSEIVAIAVLASFIFSTIFLRADMDFSNILPVFDGGAGNTASSFYAHCLWFGDFLPFLLLDVAPIKGKIDKLALPLSLAMSYLAVVFFYLVLIAIYGEVTPFIKYAFSNIGAYNSISNVLGGVHFPVVCVWMLMAIIKLSLIMYAICRSIEGVIGKKLPSKGNNMVVAIVTIVSMLILSFAISGANDMYNFMTGYIRYPLLCIDCLIVISLFIFTLSMKHISRQNLKNKHTYNEVMGDNNATY